MKKKLAKRIHIGVGRLYLLSLLEESDTTVNILANWQGTKEEAIDILKNDDREIISACPNPKPNGACGCM